MSTFAEFVQSKRSLLQGSPLDALCFEPGGQAGFSGISNSEGSPKNTGPVSLICIALNAARDELLIAHHGTRFIVRSADISAIAEMSYSIPNIFGYGQAVEVSLTEDARIRDVESSKLFSARNIVYALPFALARPSQVGEALSPASVEEVDWYKSKGLRLADTSYSASLSAYISVTGMTGSVPGISDDSGDAPADTQEDDNHADD